MIIHRFHAFSFRIHSSKKFGLNSLVRSGRWFSSSSSDNNGGDDDENKSSPIITKRVKDVSPIPQRLRQYQNRNKASPPEALLKQGQAKNEEDEVLSPEVLSEFETQVVTKDFNVMHPDYEHDPEAADKWAQDRWAYLLRRRKPGSFIHPDEYDYTTHSHDREKPPDILLNLDRAHGNFNSHLPKCQPKYKRHIIPQHMVSVANLPILREFTTEVGAIKRRNHSKLCGKCQRRVAKAIKRARQLGLIPWTVGWKEYNILGFPDDDYSSRVSKTI
uniref:Ribosomal protein S18 n=1 Tax=Aureoumbra lagunensis TaxID=44058 RepID=A0A7S3JUF0_9STRA|mmetsp:Transcript_1078/g.1341  ORF Transcript_1078/g.1341 Transcript_1078/m.1341 type:complete len:274 (+) Transcript_1078:84-905(+)